MKKLISYVGATSASVVVAGAAIAQQCSTMEAYIAIGPNHRDDVMAYIAPRLKEKFGTDLVVEERGSGPMMERITAQGSSPRVSLAFMDYPVSALACDSFCAAIDESRIPNLANYPDWSKLYSADGEVVGLAFGVTAVGLLYDEDQFAERNLPLPTSWEDLGRADLAGRVTITSPVSTWGTAMVAALAEMNGGEPGDFDPGFAKVQELLPNLHSVHTFSGELGNMMQLREVWLATTGPSVETALRTQGAPVKWVAPVEGTPAVMGGINVVKGAPCEAETYEFLDIYLSDEFQAQRITNGISSASTTVWDVADPEAVAALPLQPEDYDGLMALDWTLIAPLRAGMIERWQQEVR